MLGDILSNKQQRLGRYPIQYSQVEKAYKGKSYWASRLNSDEPRVAYFQGQFDWAQAQLDVLKGSTTKAHC